MKFGQKFVLIKKNKNGECEDEQFEGSKFKRLF